MIRLTFDSPHRSIFSFPKAELPDFTLVTGVNGSGKSHLLEAVNKGGLKVEEIAPQKTPIQIDHRNSALYNWTTLVPAPPTSADPVALSSKRANDINEVVAEVDQARQQVLQYISGRNYQFLVGLTLDGALKLTDSEITQLKHRYAASGRDVQIFETVLKDLHKKWEASPPNGIRTFLRWWSKQRGLPITLLTREQIEEAVPLQIGPINVFQQNISSIFATYYKEWERNRYNGYRNSVYGEQNRILNDQDFIERFGEPPWDFVNRVIRAAHLNYEITRPEGPAEAPFHAKLISLTGREQVSFEDLSSGEKILMSFALCLYNTKGAINRYPKVLLLDEVDAPLHPSMTRDMIRVIEEVLVGEKGVKVIMATHSPATIAFAPAGSIFRLERSPRALIPCEREQAIQTLTSGYISVTDNSRFVITEAKQDRAAYSAMFRKLVERGTLPSCPNLVFVQASDQKDRSGGGCEQVKQWGQKLPEAGLKQILGLIDRDQANAPSKTIKVLGRYSLENYLLDPIIIYALLMHRREHIKVLDVGLKNGNYYELRNADQSVLQAIVERVCGLIEKYHPAVQGFTGKFDLEYTGGLKVSAPNWLKDYRGHDLVNGVRVTFNTVVGNSFIITQNDCEDLVDMLCERLPEFIPVDLLQIFKELQTA